MSSLQRQFERSFDNLPEFVLRDILKRKLKETKTRIPKPAFEALVDHLLRGSDEIFVWRDVRTGKQPKAIQNLCLVFDQQDLDEIDAVQQRLTDTLPGMIEKLARKSGKDLFLILSDRWPAQSDAQRRADGGFRDRLYGRWGEGLDLLRMLLTCCREVAAEAHSRQARSKSRKRVCRNFVLFRLHARACQVADEILTLMENGFADGAMARWRTLHEIAAVATVIEEGDEGLAQRYIAHDAIEVKRQADDYDATQPPLGASPISARSRTAIDAEFDAAIRLYGKAFASPYGWIADHLKKEKPTFRDIQDLAGRSGMNPYYKLASYNVHAGSRSMFHRLTTLSREAVPGAGRSNAGLLQPGQNTAFTLLQITSTVMPPLAKLDRMIEMRSLIEIRDRVQPALLKADRKLRRDERALQMRLSKTKRAAKAKPRGTKKS